MKEFINELVDVFGYKETLDFVKLEAYKERYFSALSEGIEYSRRLDTARELDDIYEDLYNEYREHQYAR